jgi:transposase-like protein
MSLASLPLAALSLPVCGARYEKARVETRVATQEVLIIPVVRDDGFREVLPVGVADTKSEATYQELFRSLKSPGLKGVELVVADDHEGFKQAIGRNYREATHQRCLYCSLQEDPPQDGECRWAQRTRATDLRVIFAATDREQGSSSLRPRPRKGAGKATCKSP